MNYLQLAMLAFIISFFIVWFLIPIAIPILKQKHFGQEIRELGPQSHMKKAGTPTMGGIVLIISIFCTVVGIGLFTKSISLFSLLLIVSFGIIGFIDDYIKISRKHNEGLTVIQKFSAEILLALIFTFWAYRSYGTVLLIPFYGEFDLGFWYLPITFIAIVATTNAVNLSDGLDGLASGVAAIVMIFFLTASFSLSSSGLAVLCGSFIGTCLSFLRYNFNPAEIFMGDTGSLALGAGLIAASIETRLEFYFIIAGFIYVLEAASVLIQVGYFKISHGKRVFKMAPIHHHFELSGWKETRVVSVFYIWSALCVAIAYLIYGG